MKGRTSKLLVICFFAIVHLIGAPKNSTLKNSEYQLWKSKIGTQYYLYPGLPKELGPTFMTDELFPTPVPLEPSFKLSEIKLNSFDAIKLGFKQSTSSEIIYTSTESFNILLTNGMILDHQVSQSDPQPVEIKLYQQRQNEIKKNNLYVMIIFAILLITFIGVIILLVKRSRRIAKTKPPVKPPPHPALRSWLCASCGWLGFLGRNGNPYDVGVGVGAVATGAGAAGVVAGGAGLAGGVVLMLVGVAVFVIGIPLLLLFGIGILFMILGVVIIVIGGIISLVGGTAAGAGATIAATGAAAGAGAYAKGQAHAQRALPCPICKQALIPCASPMGKEFIASHPDVLKPLVPQIQNWLEYVRFYENETGTMIPREPWPGANQIPALAIEEPQVIEDQVSELPDPHPPTFEH